MGADIHMTVERQVHDRWICVNTMLSHHNRFARDSDGMITDISAPVATTRNYARFAALAGVRGEGPAPRGIPGDVSETTQYLIDEWGEDGHSHSWLELDEAVKIFVETGSDEKEVGEDPPYWRKWPYSFFFDVDEEKATEHDYRIVFWFDN